jgi:hypothetical protein
VPEFTMPLRLAALFVGLLLSIPALADEGMWLPNDFPAAKVKAAYGFAPDQAWLDHVRLGAVRLANGCSASLVSAHGLVMTNHQCVRGCLQQLSSTGHDVVEDGFVAQALIDEKRCPTAEADQLVAMSQVTDRVKAAIAGKSGADETAALRAVKTGIEMECAGGDDRVRCDVVTLYRGGRYDLYKYRRYQDIRLVFAPEGPAAFFGGDPDNFEFPRYDIDVGFLRIYDQGKPLDSAADHLKFASRPVIAGEPTFVVGNPFGTDRLYTQAQLDEERSLTVPRLALYLAEKRGQLTQFMERGTEQRRVGSTKLAEVENSLKIYKGRLWALNDPAAVERAHHAEAELRARIGANAELSHHLGDPWQDIAQAVERHRIFSDREFILVNEIRYASELLGDAQILIRHAAEETKPEETRLPEYSSARFPTLRQRLLSPASIPADLEALTFTYWLTKLREILGPDDPTVKQLLAGQSPEARAASLIHGTKLFDAAHRKKLLDGGAAALDDAHDPMLDFARLLDPEARAIRAKAETEYETPIEEADGRIAHAGFSIFGDRLYPDATFSMRISYGSVQGWTEPGRAVAPTTDFAGLWSRATGADPFRVTQRWLAAKSAIPPATLLNFTTTNDTIDGNSGSPVIDKSGAVIGLIFDGNIHSLGGDYFYDGMLNRAIAVGTPAIRAALDQVHHADRILKELDDSGA